MDLARGLICRWFVLVLTMMLVGGLHPLAANAQVVTTVAGDGTYGFAKPYVPSPATVVTTCALAASGCKPPTSIIVRTSTNHRQIKPLARSILRTSVI